MLLSLEVLPKPIELFYGEKIKTSSKRVSVKSSSNVSALSADALNWSRRPFGWNKRKKSLQKRNWELSNPITNARRFGGAKRFNCVNCKTIWVKCLLSVDLNGPNLLRNTWSRMKFSNFQLSKIRAELLEPSSHDENVKNRAAKTQP